MLPRDSGRRDLLYTLSCVACRRRGASHLHAPRFPAPPHPIPPRAPSPRATPPPPSPRRTAGRAAASPGDPRRPAPSGARAHSDPLRCVLHSGALSGAPQDGAVLRFRRRRRPSGRAVPSPYSSAATSPSLRRPRTLTSAAYRPHTFRPTTRHTRRKQDEFGCNGPYTRPGSSPHIYTRPSLRVGADCPVEANRERLRALGRRLLGLLRVHPANEKVLACGWRGGAGSSGLARGAMRMGS